MGAAELLKSRDGFVVGKPHRRIGGRLHCKFTDWSGNYFQMIDEVPVVPRHVCLHAFEERARVGVVGAVVRRRVVPDRCRAGWGGSGGVVHTEEDIQRVDERALCCAGPRELPRVSEIDGVPTLVLKDPGALATVLSAKPGADLVVKYVRVAAVADRVEDGGEGADDGGELAEGGGDASTGDGVVEERLVEGLLHEREGGDAGEFDAG